MLSAHSAALPVVSLRSIDYGQGLRVRYMNLKFYTMGQRGHALVHKPPAAVLRELIQVNSLT